MDSVGRDCRKTAGFPHSDIAGSMVACTSPTLFAACHVLHRLHAPRHPPCALSSLTIEFAQSMQEYSCGASPRLLSLFAANLRFDVLEYLSLENASRINRRIQLSKNNRFANFRTETSIFAQELVLFQRRFKFGFHQGRTFDYTRFSRPVNT